MYKRGRIRIYSLPTLKITRSYQTSKGTTKGDCVPLKNPRITTMRNRLFMLHVKKRGRGRVEADKTDTNKNYP